MENERLPGDKQEQISAGCYAKKKPRTIIRGCIVGRTAKRFVTGRMHT